MIFKFSGHDTFHCKQQWLLKGTQFISDNYSFSNIESAIQHLGIGKNMVVALRFWLEAFGILKDGEITYFGEKLLGQEGYDKYLEDEGSLWLLQYQICNTRYASIYPIMFNEYFNDKISYEFTQDRVVNYLERILKDKQVKTISSNTLISDFKVFIKMYVSSTKEIKTLEDDFNSPLLELNLIENIDAHTYRLNKRSRTIPLEILAFALIDLSKERNAQTLSFRIIDTTLGSYFCIESDSLEQLLYDLSSASDNFVYNKDAGMANLSVKQNDSATKYKFLNQYYGI